MKRAFLYMFILAGLILPCHLSASDIAVTGNIPTDSLIDSIALSPGTDTAFGIDKEKKSLYIIDVNNHLVTKKVSLGRRPVGIAVNPLNNLAYITLKNNSFFNKKGSLCTVDTSGAVLNTISIHGTPHGIAINPENNTVVIALEKEKKLLVLSAETMQTLQEIKLPFKPRLVALDEDSNRAVVTAGKGDFSWWQHIIMVVDLNTGAVTNTIKFRRGIKGIAVDTGKDTAVTTGLKEINLFDINTGSILSAVRECDNLLYRLKLKGCSDNQKPDDKDFEDDDDIDRDINRFLDRYLPEIDEAIVKDLKGAGSGLSAFQADHTYGLDINQSTHIAVISGEESLLLLDMNTNTLNEYPLDDIKHLRAVAVDRYRNISLVSYLKDKHRKRHDTTGVLEVQLPNPVPEISGLTPSFATSGDSDTALRISGDRFITSSAAQFSLYGLNTLFADNNTLDVIVPSALLSKACIYPVTVTNPVPSGGISNSVDFTVFNPMPFISAIDPSEAMTGTQGLIVNVLGTGFTDDSTVFINGIARNYTPVSRTKLTVSMTPADLETGGYLETSVSNPPPGGGPSNSLIFTVLNPAPVLSSISPLSVTAGDPGFTLSLTGSNFLSTSTVYFNDTPVPATYISESRIDISIAPEAITNPGTNPVKVSNAAPGGGMSGILNLTVNTLVVPDLGAGNDEKEGGEGLVGGNIRILNGNVLEQRNDLNFPSPNKMGFSFTAFYNSRSGVSGTLGYGWTHSFETTLASGCLFEGEILIRITDNTGAARFFKESSPGQYQGYLDERTKIINESGEFVWYRHDGSRYGFNAQGRLIWIADENSNRINIFYSADGLLYSVADTATGRALAFNYNSNDLIESISGPVTSAVSDGIWVRYSYDANDNLVSVTYTAGSGFDYGYTDPGDIHNLTEKRNKANHLLNTWTYDSEDKAVNSFSLDGTGVTVGYAGGTLVTVTDAYGITRTYNIAGEGSNKRVSAMSGTAGAPYSGNNAVRWEYDANMNLVEVEYAGGAINLYQNHDERGNPGTIVLASGAPEQRTINYTYHPYMNIPLTRTEASVSGSGNKVTIWDYDDDYDSTPNESPTGNLCRVIEQGFTANDAGSLVYYEYVTNITYNSKGRVLSVDGPIPGTGDTTTFAYDPATGDLTSITSPHTGSTLFQNYDNAGQPGRITDVNNHSIDYTYDARGRVTNTYHAADSSTGSTSYNTAGLIAARTDEDGVNSGYAYDGTYGKLQRIIDHENNYIEHLYDTYGNPTDKSYYTAGGVRTSWKRFNYQHPVMPGKLFREIKHDDTFMEYAYDLKGNLSGVTDFNGNVTTYEYDTLNRLSRVIQPGNIITFYTYDLHGNLQSVTDANSNTTTYRYDDMGRLIETVSPDTGVVKYAYDEAGNLKTKVDANGIVVQYAYDSLNRLTNVHYPDSSQDITYTYDEGSSGKGFRSGMTDQSGTISFGYDARGRLTDKISTVMGHAYPISRAYTPGGRVSTVAYPTGRTVDYQRGGCACNVSSISTSYNGNVVTLMNNLIYRPFGGVSGMDNGAGGIIGSQSDLSGRVTVSNPGAVHEKTYTYDNNDNLTSISAPSTPWQSRTYGYDAINRLIHAEGPFGNIDYTYDGVGNRQTKSEGGSITSYTYYPDTNRLHEAVTGAETIIHAFDPNGNITGMGGKILTYNQENRLVSVEEGGTVLGEYTYNGLGQRVIKNAGGVTTIFLYDFDGNIIGESDSNGNISREYLYKGSSRLAMVDILTGNMYYYGNDKLGTPQIMTDSTNTVVWEAEVNPNSSVVNNFRFPGQYYDAETGLHYNFHRYYEPKTGRYLTPDPIGLDSGDVNLYAYVYNNPVNHIDLSGLKMYRHGYDTKPLGQQLRDLGSDGWPWYGGWPMNGSLLPGYSSQDNICSYPVPFLNNNPCTKRCCKAHDDCYKRFGCNFSSWISPGIGLCQMCNARAVDCISSNIGKSNCECGGASGSW